MVKEEIKELSIKKNVLNVVHVLQVVHSMRLEIRDVSNCFKMKQKGQTCEKIALDII